MNTPSISVKRFLGLTMKDSFKRLEESKEIESKSLKEEYKSR